MLTKAQIRILKRIFPGAPSCCSGCVFEGKSKLEILMGEGFFSKIAGKVVIDFGCGEGGEAVEMAARGARRVIGIDNREEILQIARGKAREKGVQDTCSFATSTKELADLVVSVDAFEHFADPAEIFRVMDALLKPSGVLVTRLASGLPVGGDLEYADEITLSQALEGRREM